MASLSDLSTAVSALVGCRVSDLGRSLNMVEIGFQRNSTIYRLHAQCPFRLVRMSRIYIGSTDMLSPSDRETDPIEAYDKYLTIYDHNAKVFTEHLAKVDHYVIRAELGEGGIITFEISDSIRIEIFPAASGPVEGWRLFAKGSDVHYVYPEWADRD